MASGIRDKVAIVGMGCSKFGERWDVGAEELMGEAFTEASEEAGVVRTWRLRAGRQAAGMRPGLRE